MEYSLTDKRKKFQILLICLIIISGIILRALFLVADPPSNLSISGALIGDAGQHSYGARNKILFNEWSFDDWKPYIGTPLVDVPINYIVYKIFGINFYSQRMIPLFFSSFALLFFCFVIYKYLGSLICLISSIFISFSYPIIIFSKVGNRYFPMIFFFIISLYFFIKGASKKKVFVFILSALFIFVLGIIWLIEKKILFRHFIAYWASIFVFMTSWYLFLFLPNKHFFDFFIDHNKLVRNIVSLKQLFNNILSAPFLIQFRSDPIILIVSSVAISLYVYLRLTKPKDIPLFVEASVFWLLIGAAFHSIWGYRPTRFYIILIFPASLLAGWILSYFWKNRFKMKIVPCIISLISIVMSLIFFGILKYIKFLRFTLFSNKVYFYIFVLLLLFAVFLLILFKQKRKIVLRSLTVLFLVTSFGLNIYYFFVWSKNREHKMVNISNTLSKSIPKSNIAGNWGSILSTGTPHKTHLLSGEMGVNWRKNFLLSGEMGVNWRKNFLKEYNIKYLLLTKGRFANELREYINYFKKEISEAKRIAIFKIYNSEVYFLSLNNIANHKNRFEFESLKRNYGTVVYDPLASSNLVLRFEKKHLKNPIVLNIENGSLAKGDYILNISGKGDFKGFIVFKQEGRIINKRFLKFKSNKFESRRMSTLPIKDNLEIFIKVLRARGDIFLDYIDFIPIPF
jgi:hypothetical protein